MAIKIRRRRSLTKRRNRCWSPKTAIPKIAVQRSQPTDRADSRNAAVAIPWALHKSVRFDAVGDLEYSAHDGRSGPMPPAGTLANLGSKA